MSRRVIGLRIPATAVVALTIVGAFVVAPARAQVVSIRDARVEEADELLRFTLVLSPPSASPVTVEYRTGGDDWTLGAARERAGMATGDDDYGETSGVVTFSPGQTVKTIPVEIYDDGEEEGEEAFQMWIEATGADTWPYRAYGVIVDDDGMPYGCDEGYCYVRFPILSVYDAGSGRWNPGQGSVRVKATYEGRDDSWSMEDDWWVGRRQRDWIGYEMTRFVTSTGRVGAEQWSTESDFECNERFEVDPRTGRRILSDVDLSRSFDLSAGCADATESSCRLRILASSGWSPAYGCWDMAEDIAFDYWELERIGRFTYTEAGLVLGPGTFSTVPRLTPHDSRSDGERGVVSFTVTLDLPASVTTTVGFATVDGSAVGGVDYVTTSGVVVFKPGELRQTGTVAIVEDRLDEVDETFEIVLTNPVGAGLADARATVTIEDDDTARPNLVVSEVRTVRPVLGGSAVTVRYEVLNAGEAAAPATQLLMALSPELVLATRSVPALEPGATASGAAGLVLPALETGTPLLVVMADSGATVAESREWDNVTVKRLVSGPDLQVAMTPPAGVVADLSFGVAVRIRNLGSAPAAASFVELYRSPDGVLDGSDVRLAVTHVPALRPGDTANVTLPAVLTSGTWWLIAREDADGGGDARVANNLRRIRIIVP